MIWNVAAAAVTDSTRPPDGGVSCCGLKNDPTSPGCTGLLKRTVTVVVGSMPVWLLPGEIDGMLV